MIDVVKLHCGHCAVCGHELTDEASVARGVGPDCAKKYGPSDSATSAVCRLSAYGHARDAGHVAGSVAADLSQIHAVNPHLAGACARRFADVVLHEKMPTLLIYLSPNWAMTAGEQWEWERMGAAWDPEESCYMVLPTEVVRRGVWEHLRRFRPGHLGYGPRGPFRIPGLHAPFEAEILESTPN